MWASSIKSFLPSLIKTKNAGIATAEISRPKGTGHLAKNRWLLSRVKFVRRKQNLSNQEPRKRSLARMHQEKGDQTETGITGTEIKVPVLKTGNNNNSVS
jgi:hypothetical protein